MRFNFFKNWTFSTRLYLAGFLPISIMFFLIILYSYHSRIEEADNELADRGRIVAKSIASNSYGIIFGNTSELHRYIHSLVQSDPNIYRVDILNADKKTEWFIESKQLRVAEKRVFEESFTRDYVSIDSLESSDDNNPKVTGFEEPTQANLTATPIGYVKVTMSSFHMIQKQKNRFYILCGMAFLVLIISLFLSIYFTNYLTKPMVSIINYLKKLKHGDYAIRVPVTNGGEIGEIQSILNELASILNMSKKDLEDKVLAKTKELQASRNEAISAQQAALKADAEKRKLIQKMTTAVDDERKNISRHIHDELNAFVIAIKFDAQTINRIIIKIQHTPEYEQLRLRADSILEHCASVYKSFRMIVKGLRPETLEILGLKGAITDIVDSYNASQTNCHLTFQSHGNFRNLKGDLPITVFRIVQEALSNIIKHANAKNAFISIALNEEENTLSIRVNDDGRGFDYGATTPGVGLIGLRERVVAFDGTMKVKSNPFQGSEISIIFPITPSI